MARLLLLFLVPGLCCFSLQAQVLSKEALDTAEMTVLGKVAIGGYIDAYYGFVSDRPSSGDISYFVSSGRHNEFNINLAYVEILYRSKHLRADFTPGFGTYMDANYSNESGTGRILFEANAGVRLTEKRNIWLDAGVFVSPFTNESPVSKDHLMYSRSFAPEYVPYYVSGLRLSAPLTPQLNALVYVLNGWQVIRDNNEGKAVATQLEFRPNSSLLINWNTYLGDERSAANPNYRTRYLLDFYGVYQPEGKLSATAGTYFGWQDRDGASTSAWWQANVIGRYELSEKVSLSGRLEYFHDEDGTMIRPQTTSPSFRSWSTGACLNIQLWKNAIFRFEGRHFFGPDPVYTDADGVSTQTREWLITSLAAWF